MRKLLDINTWLALFLEGHSQHSVARDWYHVEPLMPGDMLFCRQTEMGFLRLLTQHSVMEACARKAFTNEQAASFLSKIVRDEVIASVGEVHGTRTLWLALARADQSSPNRWMDAYLAALAITNNLEMLTFDRGFLNYESAGLHLKLLCT